MSSIRTLPDLSGHLASGRSLRAAFEQASATDQYKAFVREIESWPQNSNISTFERAALHWLICETKPRAILEIGTYLAGTTMLLATSLLQANPRGEVHTIDPFGAERAPKLLANWEPVIRNRVVFWPKSSSDFFIPNVEVPQFQLIFVDGNHSYPNVLHDLFASYDALAPGGFIVVDNVEQLDVLCGTSDFLKLTPEAEGLQCAVVGGTAIIDDRFDAKDTRSAFALVRKPEAVRVHKRPLSYHVNRFPDLSVEAVQLSIFNPSDKPLMLVCRTHLRSIAWDTLAKPRPFDLAETFSFELKAGPNEVTFRPEKLVLPDTAKGERNFVQMDLICPNGAAEVHKAQINGQTYVAGRNFVAPSKT